MFNQWWHCNSWLSWHTARPINRCHFSRFNNLSFSLLKSLWRRSLSSKWNNILSSDNDKSKSSFNLLMNSSLISFSDSILLCISKDNIHMFVKSKEGANHHSSILNSKTYSEVNPLKELTSLGSHSHDFYNRFRLDYTNYVK